MAKLVRSEMDYVNKKLMLKDYVGEETVYIVIYADRKYINETITTLDEYNKTRIEKTRI